MAIIAFFRSLPKLYRGILFFEEFGLGYERI